MIKPKNPTELAETILKRSVCAVQVGAVIEDSFGNIFSWGWNHSGSGYGMHAEEHAMKRSNLFRLYGSTIYVAATRKRNGRKVIAMPCADCQKLLNKYQMAVYYRDRDGAWKRA